MNKTLKKLYNLLNFRQKLNFFFVLMIMIASAVLAQITPKAIGWLTDDILIQEQISFDKIVPILLIILAVNVINQLIIILRRIIVEDTATQTEKKARGIVISSLLKASLNYFNTTRQRQREGIEAAQMKGKHLGRPKLKVPDDFPMVYQQWKEKKFTAKEAMRRLEMSPSSFYRVVKKYEREG